MITVEKASIKHIGDLVNFQQRLAQETEEVILSAEVLHTGLTAMFDDPSKGVYYVALSGEEVVGCHMTTTEWSEWKNGTVLWIQSLYVVEPYRKFGVFKAMFRNLTDMVNNNSNFIGIRLYVDKSNTRAMKVYESMGMDGSHYTVYEWMKA
ncbi:MAG: GNAT family N-acetyltransferase [Chryseolinea sp.]